MDLVDRAALDTLHKAAQGNIPENVWAEVEKQADEVGVLGLTGVARAIIENLVVKHGSPKDKGYAALHPTARGGASRVAGGEGGKGGGAAGEAKGGGSGGGEGGGDAKAEPNGGKVSAAPRDSDADEIILYGKDKQLNLLGKNKDDQAEAYDEVRDNPPVKIKGFPKGSEGKVLGFTGRDEDMNEVLVMFGRPVTIKGVTSDLHTMQARDYGSRGEITAVDID
jgi:hypothetical protein